MIPIEQYSNRRLVTALALGERVLGAAGPVAAGVAGPWITTVARGSEFAPDAAAAALVGLAVGFGLAGLFSGQVLVSREWKSLLVVSWIAGLAAASVSVLTGGVEAVTRVATGFA